ncbi:MAG: T9SS type A sorting domain-containing protein [Bacteroidetes bacterium]|nr:T9SS type A sorting domain-containing protein [Bacteroidota bacterium]
MKIQIILILMFLSPALHSELMAQNNLSLLDEGKMWSTVEFWWTPSGPHFTTYNKIADDTLINDTLYKKIWEAKDPAALEWEMVGFIRKEGNTYFLRDLNNDEGLIYNFDLIPGDTVTVYNPLMFGNTSWISYVEDVDSVLIEPLGEYRKQLRMSGNTELDEYWIEGIGSHAGIVKSTFYIFYLTGGGSELLCVWEGDQKIFDNENFDYCYDSTVGLHETDHSSDVLSIVPVPLIDDGFIHIGNLTGKQSKIEIITIYGQNILDRQVYAGDQIRISKGDFQSGLFLVRLISDGNLRAIKKLIVQ